MATATPAPTKPLDAPSNPKNARALRRISARRKTHDVRLNPTFQSSV